MELTRRQLAACAALSLPVLMLGGNKAFADDTFDYSILDNMNVSELRSLIAEAEKRVDALTEAEGFWGIHYYVDKYDRPTDQGYVRNEEWIKGTYKGPSKKDSNLNVLLCADYEGDVFVRLFENGSDVVGNTSGAPVKYTGSILDTSTDTEYDLNGVMLSGDKNLYFDAESSMKVIEALSNSENASIFFYLENSSTFMTYIFEVETTSGFAEAYAQFEI